MAYLLTALSAVSQVLGFIPYVCIWLVARDLIELRQINGWLGRNRCLWMVGGWWSCGFDFGVLPPAHMCTHLAAFRTASNMRKQTSERLMRLPLSYFDNHATGELRRVIDGCAASTESLLAHVLPDSAGSIAMVIGMVVLLFVFDWRLGLSCLAAVLISVCCLMTMMSGKGMKFMKSYMGALVRMNETGTECSRYSTLLRCFSRRCIPLRRFMMPSPIMREWLRTMRVHVCRKPQVLQLSVLNGLVIFLLPVALVLAPLEPDFPTFVSEFRVLCHFLCRDSYGYGEADVPERGVSDGRRFAWSCL